MINDLTKQSTLLTASALISLMSTTTVLLLCICVWWTECPTRITAWKRRGSTWNEENSLNYYGQSEYEMTDTMSRKRNMQHPDISHETSYLYLCSDREMQEDILKLWTKGGVSLYSTDLRKLSDNRCEFCKKSMCPYKEQLYENRSVSHKSIPYSCCTAKSRKDGCKFPSTLLKECRRDRQTKSTARCIQMTRDIIAIKDGGKSVVLKDWPIGCLCGYD